MPPTNADEQAALLTATIEKSFPLGYQFFTIKERTPLLTTLEVLAALVKDGGIYINEPDDQYSKIFHKSD